MKANEFVKEFGLDKAILINCEWHRFVDIARPTHFDSDLDIFIHENDFKHMDESDVPMIDLKRLVGSYELVESYGGLEKSKLKIQGNRLRYKRAALLSKAIADVESCQ